MPGRPESRKREESREHEVPLGQERQGAYKARGPLLRRLEGSGPPDAVIDAPAPRPREFRPPVPVHAASPGEMATAVVLLGPLPLEQRLGLSVLVLLFEIRGDRLAAVMPDNGARTEAERPTSLLHSPADVHVVPSDAEYWVEATDRLEARLPKGHIAARNVLGFLVRQ